MLKSFRQWLVKYRPELVDVFDDELSKAADKKVENHASDRQLKLLREKDL